MNDPEESPSNCPSPNLDPENRTPVANQGPSENAVHPGAKVEFRPTGIGDNPPEILLVGCGGIARHHLQAYCDAGLRVVGLVDPRTDQAEALRKKFYPDAKVYPDHRLALSEHDCQIVDVATHPQIRTGIIRDCLREQRHVLSQKPFVVDLDEGESLVELADQCGVQLAVNQNGRWAPHFSYLRQAVADGLLGQPFAVRMSCDWDHTWVKGTAFEKVRELILYDYAIHWFDMVRCLLPQSSVEKVYASTTRAPHQTIMPKLLGQVQLDFDNAQASMNFDAIVRHAPSERTYVAGTSGVVVSEGSGNQDQHVTLTTDAGEYRPSLEGKWFPDGFRGTMCELIASIREQRVCQVAASDNLASLALCFAAIHSSRTGEPVVPGQIRKLPADAA